MDDEVIRRADLARLAAKPGLSESAAYERSRSWSRTGVLPLLAGDPSATFPMAYGAAFAVMSDLYDAGIARTRQHLTGLFKFLAIPHHEGGEALITHVLAEIAAGEPCWLVLTLWRDERSGETVPTCAVRFADETDRPIEAPSQHHAAIADYVIKLHVLLARFTERPAVH